MAWLRSAFAAISILIGGLGAAGAADAAPALWVVKDANSEIYLFGTLHALDPATQWRTPLYDQVYARSQTVWFEADIDRADPMTVNNIVARYGVDPDRPLSQKLPARELAALQSQVDVRRIDHLRPWAAALMLSMQPVLGKGARVEAGADLTVAREARGQKTVRAFESLEDQARLFAGLSEPAEVQYLTQVIHERTEGPKLSFKPTAANLEKVWAAGDLARLGPGLVGEMKAENPAFYEALLKRRNLAWADKLTAEMASSPGVELVNVGALHMVGPDGLPALMAARGFTVTRLQ